EMGVKGELAPDQRDAVVRSRRAIRTALNLIDDLVQLARAEAGAIEVDHRPVDVRRLVTEAAEENRAAAEAKGLTLDIQYEREMPRIETAAARVPPVLGNLRSNTINYPHRGRRPARASGRPDRW